jgi:hypothetical protein
LICVIFALAAQNHGIDAMLCGTSGKPKFYLCEKIHRWWNQSLYSHERLALRWALENYAKHHESV